MVAASRLEITVRRKGRKKGIRRRRPWAPPCSPSPKLHRGHTRTQPYSRRRFPVLGICHSHPGVKLSPWAIPQMVALLLLWLLTIGLFPVNYL